MKSQGSLLGAILLIASCCIGAGMLGLPVLTAQAGFKPTLLFFILSWLFMTCTGILLLEVNLWYGEHTSIMTMAERTLGKIGEYLTFLLFVGLFYSIMVAYVAASGTLVVDFFEEFTSIHLPPWMGSLALVLFFGLFVYLGTTAVDQCNRGLMIALVATYTLLVFFGLSHVNFDYLQYKNWKAALFVLPPMIISFGFHNLIPTLTNYLGGDVKKLRIAIFVGALIPLLIYLVWEFLILGMIPIEGASLFQTALDEGEMVTRTLKNAIGSSWVVNATQAFAFFSIVTSLIGVAISFVDFLADGFKVERNALGKAVVSTIVMLPPYIFAMIYPSIFFKALNYAGAFAAVILFGILPAIMVWKVRQEYTQEKKALLPGGNFSLILVICFALFVTVMELINEWGGVS